MGYKDGWKWVTRMNGEVFENNCKHDKSKGNVYISEYTKGRIYSKSSPWLNKFYYHCMSNIDLEKVKLNPLKSAEHGSN